MTFAPVFLNGRAGSEKLEERIHRMIELHFHPDRGSAFWIERAARMGLDVRREIRRLEDLALLGSMTPADLQARPLRDYIPRKFHTRMDRFILGQTSGTTGTGSWTAYRDDEFTEAFVLPFVEAARHVGFPAQEPWLFVGPSGPHIIGRVARHLANAFGAADAFAVDFDARWVRRLPEGSFARERYIQHLVEQAGEVIARQEVGVLFTTPAILQHLAEALTPEQRARIHGVHYGGMALAPDALQRFQQESFPKAVHLSGYGNTLFGCCLELNVAAGRQLDYFPYGDRLIFEVVDEEGNPLPPGETGRVRFTRLDESMLMIRMLERDEGVLVAPPENAPAGFQNPGIRNPCAA
ncbi:MAG TPA: hypothetical protein PKC49_03280, partial [Phycisphaerae bacterium]|nr:hypothetical protein [Phycisphaerae bacterium]